MKMFVAWLWQFHWLLAVALTVVMLTGAGVLAAPEAEAGELMARGQSSIQQNCERLSYLAILIELNLGQHLMVLAASQLTGDPVVLVLSGMAVVVLLIPLVVRRLVLTQYHHAIP